MRGVRRCLPGPCRVHLGTEAEIGVSPRSGGGVPSPPGSPIPTIFPQILALNDPFHGGRMSRALRVPTWGGGAGTPSLPKCEHRLFSSSTCPEGAAGAQRVPLGQTARNSAAGPSPAMAAGTGSWHLPCPPLPPPPPGTHGGQEKPLSPPVPGHPSH